MAFQRKACKSSFIRAYRYCPDQKVLEIEFGSPLTGDAGKDQASNFGHYEGVSPEAFEAFSGASSHGAHLSKQIIPKHTYKAGRAV